MARGTAGALIEDAALAEAQALGMIRDCTVFSIDGKRIELDIDTLCLHGDSPQAVGFATRLRSALQSAGVRIGTAAR